MDETYIRIGGRWHSLYRAIDREGNLVDTMLSETRDLAFAKAFFKHAIETVGHKPERVTTDRHDAYPRAIRRTAGRKVALRTSQYLNKRLEQDHRAVKQPCYPMRGFGAFTSAARFCTAFDELRQYVRSCSTSPKPRPLPEQRRLFRQRFTALFVFCHAA